MNQSWLPLARAMDKREAILNRRSQPARLNSTEAATLLGVCEAELAILANKKILSPLGSPSQNATKWWAREDIESITESRPALEKITRTLYSYRRTRNFRATKPESENSAVTQPQAA